MGLLTNLSKKKEVEYIKEDIDVYVAEVNESMLINKDYVLIGVFNKDGTKFKNLLSTDEGYLAIEGLGDLKTLEVNGKRYHKLKKSLKISNDIDGDFESARIEYDQYVATENGLDLAFEVLQGKVVVKVEDGISPLMKNIYKFYVKKKSENVKLKEVKNFAKDINKFIYKTVKEKLEKAEKENQTRQEYNNF